jgi:hypothetical protein
MKRTYSVKFKSASKKLTTPEKVEATKKAILEEAKMTVRLSLLRQTSQDFQRL